MTRALLSRVAKLETRFVPLESLLGPEDLARLREIMQHIKDDPDEWAPEVEILNRIAAEREAREALR